MKDHLVTKLILLFFLAQLIGLLTLSQYIDFHQSAVTGTTATTDNYVVAPPAVENPSYSFAYIILAVIAGTIIVLVLIKLNAMIVWRIWFLLSITVAMTYAFYPMLHRLLTVEIALSLSIILALVLGYLKIFNANYLAHTISELLIYGGLAAIFVPILNVISATIMLILLAIYDYYMVNTSGHMVTLAKASMDSKMISGLFVGTPKSESMTHEKSHSARTTHAPKHTTESENTTSTGVMVGGGDIAFPLFFAGALMKYTGNLTNGILVAVCATAGMIALFAIAKKGKFYPAIPFVAAGCLIALAINLLL